VGASNVLMIEQFGGELAEPVPVERMGEGFLDEFAGLGGVHTGAVPLHPG